MQENPVISDWVPISGGSTEGLLGEWLAQRQAALREVMAAGALSTFTLGLPCVPILLKSSLRARSDEFSGSRKELRNSTSACPIPAGVDEQTASIGSFKMRVDVGETANNGRPKEGEPSHF